MNVLGSIAVLALLIVVHELGHFIAARSQGIHVNRFSLGFGPVLFKYQGTETEYAVRAFPLGGYVGFPDDDPDSKIPPNDPNLLRNRPVLDRAIVISAGVIANLIFAYLVLVIQSGLIGVPAESRYQPGVLVPQVIAEQPAARSGIKAGDIILAVDNQELGASEKSISALKTAIENHPNQSLLLKVQRGKETFPVKVTPKPEADSKGHIGISLLVNRKNVYRHSNNVFEILSFAAEQFQQLFVLTVKGFGQLVTNFQSTVSQVAGPVGIVKEGAQLAQSDPANLLFFAAVVSINLAILNILPLPALDGGQLAFLLIEGVRGKPLPTHIQDGVMQTGLMLLLGLGIFLIVRDITQL